MRNFLTLTRRRLTTGWLWPLILLALPGCFLDATAYDPPSEIFQPGEAPLTGLIMCDIPKVWSAADGNECATQDDIDSGLMPSTNAAVALNAGDTADIVLDWSPDALLACNNMPRKTKFHGTYPNGLEVCLNCETQIPAVYADANAACMAKCEDLVAQDEIEPPGSAKEFCQARAHVSVNFNPKMCFEGFCTNGGMPSGFPDPRIPAEDVAWTDLQGTTLEDNGFTLQFAGPGNGTFSAGAASEQLITEGDAWIEFEAGETGVSHTIGLRTSCPKILDCPDGDGSLGDIPFVLSLNVNGEVNVVQDGATIIGGPFTPAFAANERFRIYATDNHDGTASLSFTRIAPNCSANCESPLYPLPPTAAPTAAYPLRVDASFREGTATLKNVKLMRIKK